MFDKFIIWLKGVLGYVKAFLSPLALEIAKAGGTFLLETAMEAVKKAEDNGGSGSEKWKFAKEYIVDRLEQEGMAIVTVAIHGAIEASVAKLKQEGSS